MSHHTITKTLTEESTQVPNGASAESIRVALFEFVEPSTKEDIEACQCLADAMEARAFVEAIPHANRLGLVIETKG